MNGVITKQLPNCKGNLSSYFIKNQEVSHQVEKFWELENACCADSNQGLTIDDKRVVSIWNESAFLLDGHYTFEIPKQEHPICQSTMRCQNTG